MKSTECEKFMNIAFGNCTQVRKTSLPLCQIGTVISFLSTCQDAEAFYRAQNHIFDTGWGRMHEPPQNC